MALLQCCGFDHFTALTPAPVLTSFGFSGGTPAPGQGRFGGGALVNPGTVIFPKSLTSFYFGFACNNPQTIQTIALTPSFACQYGYGPLGVQFLTSFLSGTGEISPQVFTHDYSTFANSGASAFVPDTIWQYFEMFFSVAADGSGGAGVTMTVRVNEKTVVSGTFAIPDGTLTGSPYVSGLKFSSSGSPVIDDVYLCDTTGSTLNTFLGNVGVTAQMANGAGASTQWTANGSATSNWQAASNPYMDDSAYVASNAAGALDLYTVAPLANAPTVLAVQTELVARQDDVATHSLQTALRSGSTVATGTAFTTGTSYQGHFDIFPTDPNTSQSWTYQAANAMQIGAKLVS